MKEFIEKHRRLLQAYCLITRIIGWFLILGGIVWFFAIVRNVWLIAEEQQQIDFLLYVVSALVYDFVVPGFLAFAIGGLLNYLLRPETKLPLILGMTDKLCYIYAFFLILRFVGAISAFGNSPFWFVNFKFLNVSEMSESARLVLVQPLLGPTLAKVLLLIGIGMILHRLLPVIEESKTLV